MPVEYILQPVFDDDHGAAGALLNVVNELNGLLAGGGVQVGKGLVKEQHIHLIDHDAAQGYPLLLPPGNLVGGMGEHLPDVHQLGNSVHRVMHFGPGYTVVFQGEGNVLRHRQSDKLAVGVLKHGAHCPGKTKKPLPDGTSVVIARQGPGGIFADVLAGGQNQSPVNVLAAEATTVLYLPAAAVLQPGTALPSLQVRLLQNWLSTVTHKYFALDDRLELLCCKSLRQRIGLWLVGQCQSAGADSFTTPLTRAELAAYLNCDRSALCRELSRMQQDGLITLRRGGFTVHNRRKLTERNGSHE